MEEKKIEKKNTFTISFYGFSMLSNIINIQNILIIKK